MLFIAGMWLVCISFTLLLMNPIPLVIAGAVHAYLNKQYAIIKRAERLTDYDRGNFFRFEGCVIGLLVILIGLVLLSAVIFGEDRTAGGLRQFADAMATLETEVNGR